MTSRERVVVGWLVGVLVFMAVAMAATVIFITMVLNTPCPAEENVVESSEAVAFAQEAELLLGLPQWRDPEHEKALELYLSFPHLDEEFRKPDFTMNLSLGEPEMGNPYFLHGQLEKRLKERLSE